MEEANKYSRARDERDALRVQQALWRLFHLQARIRTEEDGYEAANVALTGAENSEEALSERVAKAAEMLAKVRNTHHTRTQVFKGERTA